MRADPTRYRLVTAPFTVEDGPLTLTIDTGLLVPVFSGLTPNDRSARGKIRLDAWAEDGLEVAEIKRGNLAFVGFVWVAGTGEVELTWNERADSTTFANHLVRTLDQPREALIDVAHGAPWTAAATEALVLTVDPRLQEIFLGPEDPAGDPLELVVYGEKERPGALDRAKSVLQNRSDLLAEVGVNIGTWVARDRVAVARHSLAAAQHALIDVHVDQNLGNLNLAADHQPRTADWLTLLRDGTGVMDTRRGSTVSVIDRTSAGAVTFWRATGVPFPPSDPKDPLSPPTAPVRMVADEAYIFVAASDGGAFVQAQITARMRLKAVGGFVESFELHIPRAGSRAAFEVVSAKTPEGVSLLSESPLVVHDPILGAKQPDEDPAPDEADAGEERDPGRREKAPKPIQVDPYHDRPESRITLIPPEPLADGDALVVDVVWRDRWPLIPEMLTVTYEGGSAATPAGGAGSGRRSVIPRLPGAPEGNPTKFRVRITAQSRKNVVSAASGAQLLLEQGDEWTTVESGNLASAATFVDVSLGPFQRFDTAAEGFPVVRMRMLDKGAGQEVGPEIRRQILYYEGFLPKYPWPEHEAFQVPNMPNGWVWVAAHEMTALMKTTVTDMATASALRRDDDRHISQRVLAHELAHQWWGHHLRPAHSDDFWFAETFAESMAQMYMGAVRGTYERGLEQKRETWEKFEGGDTPRASLTDAYHSTHQPEIVYDYGPYVFQQVLRPRIGHEAYHGALDLLMRDLGGKAATTEQIQLYLERASSKDLGPFFDFWVHGGFIPEQVELAWSWSGGAVRGTVTSDVPFGTFEYPVQIDDQIVWVEVVDGTGRFEQPASEKPTRVEGDPNRNILAAKRVDRELGPQELPSE